MKYVVEFELLETEKEIEEFCLELLTNLDNYDDDDDDYCCAVYETIEHCCSSNFAEYVENFLYHDVLFTLYLQIVKEIEPWIMSHCNDSDKVKFLTLKRILEE